MRMCIGILHTMAKRWKQPKGSLVDEWINELWCICTTEYYSAIKSNEILAHGQGWPWLVWFSGLSISLRTESVAGLIPSQGTCLG